MRQLLTKCYTLQGNLIVHFLYSNIHHLVTCINMCSVLKGLIEEVRL